MYPQISELKDMYKLYTNYPKKIMKHLSVEILSDKYMIAGTPTDCFWVGVSEPQFLLTTCL